MKGKRPAKMANRVTERAPEVKTTLVLSFERTGKGGALRPRRRWERVST